MTEPKCPRCRQAISPEDTIHFSSDGMAHVDCRRPRDLRPVEHALLLRYCWKHAVGMCVACAKSFRPQELGADLLSHRANLCPRCRADLTESVRGHLYSCAMLPEEVRRRAREARDTAWRLIKQSHELSDHSDVLMREAEAAIAALREAMWRTSGR
jgi:hypothetical protein